MATAGLGTLVDWHVLYPKGNETSVSMTRDNPGPFPCPSGDILGPFGSFPPPGPGTNRWYRLKGVYFDGNAAGKNNVQVIFNMFSGHVVTFTFPQVASGEGASGFLYSDWYTGGADDGGHAHVVAKFVSRAPYNNPAGIYSLIIEAHDVPA